MGGSRAETLGFCARHLVTIQVLLNHMTVIMLAFGRPDAITAFLVFRDTGTLGDIRQASPTWGLTKGLHA